MRELIAAGGMLALAGAALATILVAASTGFFTLRPPSGADAMGLALPFLLQIFAWVLTLVAVLIAIVRDAFAWAGGPPGSAGFAAVAVLVGLAIAGNFAFWFSLEVRYSSRTAVGLLGALVLPLVAQAYVAALLVSDRAALASAAWVRAAGWPLAAIALAGWVLGAVFLVKTEQEKLRVRADAVRHREESRLDEARRASQQDGKDAAALAALPDDAPLEQFLEHLFIDKSEAQNLRAVARIRALPNLTERLAERLRHREALQREYAASFIRVCKDPDPAWVPAVRGAFALLADDYRAEAKDPVGRISHVKGLTLGLLRTAENLAPARFDEEARVLRAALEEWPDKDVAAGPIALVDDYLAGKPLPR